MSAPMDDRVEALVRRLHEEVAAAPYSTLGLAIRNAVHEALKLAAEVARDAATTLPVHGLCTTGHAMLDAIRALTRSTP